MNSYFAQQPPNGIGGGADQKKHLTPQQAIALQIEGRVQFERALMERLAWQQQVMQRYGDIPQIDPEAKVRILCFIEMMILDLQRARPGAYRTS
jgi:hypothetical protein